MANLKLPFDLPVKKYFQQFVGGVSRFQIALTLLVFAVVVAGASMSVSTFVNPPADQSEVNKRLVEIQKVEFNETAITRIEALRDSNVDIDSQFDPDRENPFIE